MAAHEVRSGRRIEDARRLAESGELDAAAEIFAELASDEREADRAQAAVGLAVVLEQSGDVTGARAAARVALATGHPEYAAQAACHLARGFERDDMTDQARAAWQAVIGVGTPAYLPAAHLALARIAVQQGDDREAEASLRAALATRDGGAASLAAQRLAEYLLGEGEPGEAADVLIEALDIPDVTDAGRLRVLLGIAHLDMACGQFAAAVESGTTPAEDGPPPVEHDEDPYGDAGQGDAGHGGAGQGDVGQGGPGGGGLDAGGAALAIELLARVLPLRGRDDDAEAVWAYGLDHPDPDVADQVRRRLHRAGPPPEPTLG
ncbi:tetratricopeptide repeat protein [Sphaerisporangium corydalis]|uniref:Tetratricopeptide repeat protein n=1 Tax=Sphaerisporangium corydalis TaxID=1441875 RepID=A0ABV9EGR8_9ACTN|nr:tetratricopeptide repeat protein [Sphaerisporangium corydalis]